MPGYWVKRSSMVLGGYGLYDGEDLSHSQGILISIRVIFYGIVFPYLIYFILRFPADTIKLQEASNLTARLLLLNRQERDGALIPEYSDAEPPQTFQFLSRRPL
jgi:hypothetical protein